MKDVEITRKKVRKEKYGGCVVTLEYVVTDEIGRKSDGSASYATSQEDQIQVQGRVAVQQKLGYEGFNLKWPRETLKANGRA